MSNDPTPGNQPMTNERPTCGAKTKSGHCRSYILMRNGRCRLHGGATPRGIASASWKHGRYSKVMPKRLMERYAAALNDPELGSVRDEMAATTARIGELFERLDYGETHALIERLESIHDAMVIALIDDDPVKQLVERLGEALRQSTSDRSTWAEIGECQDRIARLSQAEQRRIAAVSEYINAEDALVYAEALSKSVRRRIDQHVSDAAERARVLADIASDLQAFAPRSS